MPKCLLPLGLRRPIRIGANSGLCRLLRILQRICSAFCSAPRRPVEVGIGHRQVVPHRNLGGVAQPAGYHVKGIVSRKLRFPAQSQILEGLGPRLHAGPRQDSVKLGPQVRVTPAVRPLGCRPVGVGIGAAHHVHFPLFGPVPRRLQLVAQLGEEGNNPATPPGVVFGLGAVHANPVRRPVDASQLQAQNLGRGPQPAVSAQNGNQSPSGIAGRQNLGRCLSGNEPLPVGRVPFVVLHVAERVFVDQPAPLRSREHLPGPLKPLRNRRIGQPLTYHRKPYRVGIGRADFPQGPAGAKALDKVPLHVPEYHPRSRFDVDSAVDVAFDELAQRRPFPGLPGLAKSGPCNPGV
ncbi:MAG: hypothetical protein RBS80_30285 [Thermoguttaceae bacterium]|nr:hypothetical protein [Thermoguttaceae bacterium]